MSEEAADGRPAQGRADDAINRMVPSIAMQEKHDMRNVANGVGMSRGIDMNMDAGDMMDGTSPTSRRAPPTPTAELRTEPGTYDRNKTMTKSDQREMSIISTPGHEKSISRPMDDSFSEGNGDRMIEQERGGSGAFVGGTPAGSRDAYHPYEMKPNYDYHEQLPMYHQYQPGMLHHDKESMQSPMIDHGLKITQATPSDNKSNEDLLGRVDAPTTNHEPGDSSNFNMAHSMQKRIIPGPIVQTKEKDELPRRILHFSPSPGKLRSGSQPNTDDVKRMGPLSTMDGIPPSSNMMKDASPSAAAVKQMSSDAKSSPSPTSMKGSVNSTPLQRERYTQNHMYPPSRTDDPSELYHDHQSNMNDRHSHNTYGRQNHPSPNTKNHYNNYGMEQRLTEGKYPNYDPPHHPAGNRPQPSASQHGYNVRNYSGSYMGMQASRLAYEQDRAASVGDGSSIQRHSHLPPPSMPPHDYNDDTRTEKKSEDAVLRHYHAPQASPALDRRDAYCHDQNDSKHRRHMNEGGNDDKESAVPTSGASEVDKSKNEVTAMKRDVYANGFDGMNNNFSPAVAISRRGCSKRRSPYDERSYHEGNPTLLSQSSPQSLPRHASAVRYCTPIVTGGDRNRTAIFPPSAEFDSENGKQQQRQTPSSKSPHYEDPYDSHLRHYHRPYPSAPSPARYGTSPKRGSPRPYATPDMSRAQPSSSGHSQDPTRDRPFYDNVTAPPYHPNQPYHRSAGKENFYFPAGAPPHYMPYGGRIYSPYDAAGMMGGHLDYRSQHHLPPHEVANVGKKRRVNQNEGQTKKPKAKAVKPPRRKKMYSDFVGVTYNKTHAKFQACITHYRKQHYLGRYKLAVDAAKAYDDSAKELKGDGWKINFQTTEEYEKAKAKEIEENEKKRAAALAGEKANTNALPAKSSNTTKSFPQNLPSSLNGDKKEGSNPSNRHVKFQNVSDTMTKTSRRILPSAQSSSAVTPSPHAHNLNKQSSLMNEPLISPMVKGNNSSSQDGLLPTPLKPLTQTFSDKDSPLGADSFISGAFFTSPLQNDTSEKVKVKREDGEEPPSQMHDPSNSAEGESGESSGQVESGLQPSNETEKQKKGASNNQNGALAAASALLMIRQ